MESPGKLLSLQSIADHIGIMVQLPRGRRSCKCQAYIQYIKI